jgi:hypothetical protein
MSQPIETDIEILPYEPIEGSTWWPYDNGSARLAYRLNKDPGDKWAALFAQVLKERTTATNKILEISQVRLEKLGRFAVTCIVNERLKERVLSAIGEAVGTTNQRAVKQNEEAESELKADAKQAISSHESAKRIAESMKGKK